MFSSDAELVRAIDAAAIHCPAATHAELAASFFESVRKAGIDWDQESLVVVQDYYGTGMARAHLDLSVLPDAGVKAAIVWEVPPPPVTPDTATSRFAFAVDRTRVKRVVVTGRDPREHVIPVPNPAGRPGA